MRLETETIPERPWNREPLRVPRADESLLSRPILSNAVDLVGSNAQSLSHCGADLQGRTLDQMRQWSRQQVLAAAAEYTSFLTGETITGEQSDFILTGGHQPSLFHPGVWVKNFAIGELAARTGGIAVNLVIDNDTLSPSRVRLPGGTRKAPEIQTVPFDREHSTGPWEEAVILDEKLFNEFGSTVVARMRQWNIEPIIGDIWSDAVTMRRQSTSLRDCLTAARCRLERKWGLANLELPISRMCQLDSFLWFAAHVIAQLPRFRHVYNEVLTEFRRVNRIRSRTHPVPDLAENEGWLEAPFWVWRAEDQQRQRLFVKQTAREVHLSDGKDVFAKLSLTPEMDACCAVEALRELEGRGIRLRTRALTTTLFARLCFSDLFVHGIGGSKYDEMTDRIISRFFSVPAPAFLTLSATLQLPISESSPVIAADVTRLTHQARDLEYNPDRHLSPGTDPEIDQLTAEKAELIAEQQAARTTGATRRERRLRSRSNHARYRRFQEINEQLTRFTQHQQQQLQQELDTTSAQLAAGSVLHDREYSFCLYPAEKIQPFMTQLWERSSP